MYVDSDGSSYLVPLTSYFGEDGVTLTAPEEVVPNEVFDLFLEVSPPGRPDLRVPATDIDVNFSVEDEAGEATIVGESALGVRVAVSCSEVTLSVNLARRVPDTNVDDVIMIDKVIPLSTTCAGTTVGVDFAPPFVSVTSPSEGEPFAGAFTLSGEVNDMQTGVDRVEVYGGPVLLGEAELDSSAVPNTWSFDVTPDQLRDYRLTALAYDNAMNENPAELQVSAPDAADLTAL